MNKLNYIAKKSGDQLAVIDVWLYDGEKLLFHLKLSKNSEIEKYYLHVDECCYHDFSITKLDGSK